jgi:hypothetical protein
MATTQAGTGMIEWRCMGRQVKPVRPVTWGGPIVHLSVSFVSLVIRITFFAAASGNAVNGVRDDSRRNAGRMARK